MKTILAQSLIALSKIQKHHIQFFLLLVTVVMLVLGAGAPTTGGGAGIH